MEDYIGILKQTFLCQGLSDDDFQYFIKYTNIQMKKYHKNEFIFMEREHPEKLFLLIDGSVSVYRDTMSGKVVPIADIEEQGDIFGEVYLYMQKEQYDINAIAKQETTILAIESKIFKLSEEEVLLPYYKIAKNLLTMFAMKAYLLNTKIQVLNSGTLRQRIVRYFLNCRSEGGKIHLNMTREKMAEFLNTTRPSLSRELSNMQKEGLIEMHGKEIILLEEEKLDEFL